MEYYQCYVAYISTTRATRISNTVQFFPHTYKMPRLSSTDAAMRAASDLTAALQNPAPAAPFLEFGTATSQALKTLAGIFSTQISTDKNTPKTLHTPDKQIPPPSTTMITRAVAKLNTPAPLQPTATPLLQRVPVDTHEFQRVPDDTQELQRVQPAQTKNKPPSSPVEPPSYSLVLRHGCSTRARPHRYPTRVTAQPHP